MLPTTAFKSVVRAEFVMKNTTVEAVEYVDESVNAATIVVTQNGQKSTIIMSYQTNEVFYVVPSSSSGLLTAGLNIMLVILSVRSTRSSSSSSAPALDCSLQVWSSCWSSFLSDQRGLLHRPQLQRWTARCRFGHHVGHLVC